MIYNIKFLIIITLFFGVSFEFVSADAWWGEGYKTPEWVIAHGGTLINYKVTGTSHTDHYKAMMFRDGKYVEVEFGKNAQFDDAKDGTYLINFYKCHKSCSDHKFNKKTKIRDKDKIVTSITIVARPGQTNNLIFNAENKTVQVIGRSGGKKIEVVDPFVEQVAIAKKYDGETCNYEESQQQSKRLNQFLFLSHNVDAEKFRDVNIDYGILPTFLVKNNI